MLPLLMRTTHGMAMTAMQSKPEDVWLVIEGAMGSAVPIVRMSGSSWGSDCWLEAEWERSGDRLIVGSGGWRGRG